MLIAVYGAGGFGREVAWMAESCCAEGGEPHRAVCFVDDNPGSHGGAINGLPVMSLEDARYRFPGVSVAVAVGKPSTRAMLVERASAVGLPFATLIHLSTLMSQWVSVGEGTLICAGNIITTNIVLGSHVHVNLGCTIGHDVILGDYCTLSPGVHVSGWVHIGKRVLIGTGAVIINGTEDHPLTIGDDVIIGAGACVTKAVEPGLTVVGVPAKPLNR